MEQHDADLVARWVAGDREALETLYRRHARRVWRYGWFQTRSRDAAADIVQETFLRVAQSLERFEGRSSFATWLFAVARSVAVDQARRNGRARNLTLQRPTPAAGEPVDPLEAADTRNAVRRAVADLPAAQRDAVVLCELQGLSIREAGDVLGWKESRVKVTLFRARRKLRDRLRSYVSDAPATPPTTKPGVVLERRHAEAAEKKGG